MDKHCSFRTGGIAQNFFVPQALNDLSKFLKNNQKPILMLGLGSNLLIRDQGFDGVVIQLKHFSKIDIDESIVHADSGVTLAKLSRFCESKNLHGAEFLSAIPGTVGGALKMNAGAFGSEIWQFVESVTTINASGLIHERNKTEFEITYRQVLSKNKNEYFISASFIFNQDKKQQDIKALLKKRNDSQPIGKANCGSVFKNPKDNFAARLIENSGLKGFCIGDACVSDKHANFIINQGKASAGDIEKLIIHIQLAVKTKFNIDLKTEVTIV